MEVSRMRPVRLAILGLVPALAFALASFSSSVAAASPAPTITSLAVSPAVGPTNIIRAQSVKVTIAVANFRLSGPSIGKPEQPGVGHWHLHLDGMPMAMNGMQYSGLVDMEFATTHTLSLIGVAPGKHTLQAILTTNTHMELANPEAVKSIDFVYAPRRPWVSVKLAGTTRTFKAGSTFKVKLKVKNFTATEDYFGKVNVPGIGHLHLYVDGYGTGLAMAHMVDMVGAATTDTINTTGLAPGKHTVWARLVDNAHMPLNMDPLILASYGMGYPDIVSAPVTFFVK